VGVCGTMSGMEKRVVILEEEQKIQSVRTTRNEEKITSIVVQMSGQAVSCLRIHEALDKRLEKYINNEIHALTLKLEEVQAERRQSLSRKDVIKLVGIIITVSGAVAVAIIYVFGPSLIR